MMRLKLVLGAVTLLMASSAAGGEWRLGPQVGISSSGLNGDSPSGISMGKTSGLAAGFIVETRLAADVWLSLQPMYLQRGTTTKIAVSGQPEKLEGPTLSLDYVAIPILAKIVSGNGRTYVMGGLNPAFMLEAKLQDGGTTEDFSSALNSFDLSANFGFGLMVPIGRPTLSFEVRYEQSILNLAASDRQEDDDVLPVRFRSTGFLFLAGLQWPLGGK